MPARFYLDQDMTAAELLPVAGGTAGVFSTRSPIKAGTNTPNEDAAAVITAGEDGGILVVADGLGGSPAGEKAARVAIQELATAIEQRPASDNLGDAIRRGIGQGNDAVMKLGVGAATTLVVAELSPNRLRPYHVGDSHLLVVGQRGKRKLMTVAHSPVGYAVASGLLDERAAMHHAARHVVSNVVGTPDMHLEVGPPLRLQRRDTLLLASDGLFDNLHVEEVIEIVRCRRLPDVLSELAGRCRGRMAGSAAGEPHKPDDLTFLVWRRH